LSFDGVRLHLVDSIDEVLALRSWLGERRAHHALAFDTETTGLIIGTDRVRLAQVGDQSHGWAIPLDRWGGVFEDLCRTWDGGWIAHNAKFDVGMLDHEGIFMPRPRISDTRIMHHVLFPHYSTALKSISERLIDAKAAHLQSELDRAIGGKGGWTWATVPITYQPYWSYAALDTVLTYQVYDLLLPQVEDDAPDAFELENSVSWVIERMERYGAHIDTKLAQTKYIEFMRYVDETAAWVKNEYGVSAGSNAAIVKILQGEGYEFNKATASGAVALDKEVLGGIDHPLAVAILQRRRLQKLASTYLLHFANETDENSLIHPSINVLGARTSRMSMERPNLQNLPRKSETNPAADVVRSCVTAREGHVMLMCDFDQVEMRIMAHMAKEQSMIDAFKGETDFFVALARMVYNDESIVKSDPRRQVVKNAGYATIYGAGVEKFARTAGITYEQGQAVRHRWNALFPGVTRLQQEVQNVAIRRRTDEGLPYVRCPVTRRRQVADPGKEYALVNFLIQGAAAAVLKKKLIELDSAGLGEYMVVPVHDEIILDVPLEALDDAADTLRDIMNDDTMFDVPLSASVSYGPTWGSKESYVHRGS
jgi:DNA polymerase-1